MTKKNLRIIHNLDGGTVDLKSGPDVLSEESSSGSGRYLPGFSSLQWHLSGGEGKDAIERFFCLSTGAIMVGI